MDERYGADKAPKIGDVEWITDAAENDDVILCKDLRIARNPLEAATVDRTMARAFGLARRDIDGQAMVRCFLEQEPAIFRMARRARGPYVVSVSRNGLRRMTLNLTD
jgi:hypothetical protein